MYRNRLRAMLVLLTFLHVGLGHDADVQGTPTFIQNCGAEYHSIVTPPVATSQQGPPGKRGPKGEHGEQGAKGKQVSLIETLFLLTVELTT